MRDNSSIEISCLTVPSTMSFSKPHVGYNAGDQWFREPKTIVQWTFSKRSCIYISKDKN